MKKSKYLVLSSFYFDFNDDLTEITNVKELFKNQNILDIFRFDKLISIKKHQFMKNFFNFIYLPQSIKIINSYAFGYNKIQILDLSNCINLKEICKASFNFNEIKILKLPQNVEIIQIQAFNMNRIKILDLSNCINLKKIDMLLFFENEIEYFRLPRFVETIYLNINSNFNMNDIKILNLTNYKALKFIALYSFENSNIKQLKLPKNIEKIDWFAFMNNQIESLDLSYCKQLGYIGRNAFFKNPIKDIEILNDITIEYDKNNKDDMWNKFVKYYNNNNKKSGNYKLENNKWKWYPL